MLKSTSSRFGMESEVPSISADGPFEDLQKGGRDARAPGARGSRPLSIPHFNADGIFVALNNRVESKSLGSLVLGNSRHVFVMFNRRSGNTVSDPGSSGTACFTIHAANSERPNPVSADTEK